MPDTVSFARMYRIRRAGGILAALAATVLIVDLAPADTLRTPNGEKLEGTIVQETGDVVVFKSVSFGEIRVPRVPGLELIRGAGTPAPAAAVAAAGAPARPTPPPPSPGWLQKSLGLSDRWSAEVEANLMLLSGEHRVRNQMFEATLGYKIPNPQKPQQPRHEFGAHGAYSLQKVDGMTAEENSEVAFRYFFHSDTPWMVISQADWKRDRPNLIEDSANAIVVPAYKFINRESTRFLVGVGPSYRSESRILMAPRRAPIIKDQDTFRVAMYQVIHHRFAPRLTLRETLLVQARPSETSTYSLRLQTSLRQMITEHLSINLNYEHLRDRNEEFPQQTTNTLRLTAGYNF